MKGNKAGKKRFLSVVLSLTMCWGLVTPAFAASLEEYIQNENNWTTQTVTGKDGTKYERTFVDLKAVDGDNEFDMDGDIETDKTLRVVGNKDNENSVIINMNGHTLTHKEDSVGAVIEVRVHGELTINGAAEGTTGKGVITGGQNDGPWFGNEEYSFPGGGIHAAEGAQVKISDVSIENNKAGSGGGIAASALPGYDKMTTVTLDNVDIKNNTAKFEGGGIYSNGAVVNLNNTTVDGNKVLSDSEYATGGGIAAAAGAQISLKDSTVSNNSAVSGGGIFTTISGNAKPNITIEGNSSITKNTAVYGGGIYNFGNIDIEGGKITNNRAESDGGGIFNVGTIAMRGGEISENSACYGGGVLNDSFGDEYKGCFKMEGGKISKNTSSLYGGGIYNTADLTVEDGEISENKSSYDGGGIYSFAGNFTMTGGKIMNNTAEKSGGGVYGEVYEGGSGSITMTGGVIYNNEAISKFGDDIYSARGVQLTLVKAEGMNAVLKDGKPITGWFYDGDDGGWSNGEHAYVIQPNISDGTKAAMLKAAHDQYFNVTYTGEGVEETLVGVEKGSDLPNVTPVREGCYEFAGWKLADGSDVPENATVTGDMTLVAQWIAKEHEYGEGKITTAPTCAAEGEMTYTCTACGETKTEAVAKLDTHTWDEATVEATCTKDGSITRTCTVCNTVETESIPATGHDDGAWATTVAPGPGTPGEETRTCTKCGAVLEIRELPALPVPPVPDDEPGYDGPAAGPDAPVVEIDEADVPLAGLPEVLTLAPEEKLTRGQLIAILHWLDSEPAAALATFLDVAAESDFAEAIGWAQTNDIAVGDADNNFFPERIVTRGQLVEFLNRYAVYVGSDFVLELEGDPDEELTWSTAEAIINDFFARLYA